MKRISILVFMLLGSVLLTAQVPHYINFQGSVKKSVGKSGVAPPPDISIISFKILVVDSQNVEQYAEFHNGIQTDSFGSFYLQIGNGVQDKKNTKAPFAQLTWAGGNKYLIVYYQHGSTFTSANPFDTLRRIELVTVPYAFAAEQVSGIIANPANHGDIMRFDTSGILGNKKGVWKSTPPYQAGNGIVIRGMDTIENTSITPAGAIIAWAGDTIKIPAGWLLCDGRPIPRSKFPSLFNAIGTNWGDANGKTGFFNVPDMRGMFLRGASLGSGNDPDASSRTALHSGGNSGDKAGSFQVDTIKVHAHMTQPSAYYQTRSTSISTINGGAGSNPSVNTTSGGSPAMKEKTLPFGGAETRPKNVYVNYIIKY